MADEKKIFVRLSPEFRDAICTDTDPNHPNGPELLIVKGKGDERPVYEASQNPYIKGKIREGILEEVRDFTGTPRNDPDHPDHPDNPDNAPAKTDQVSLAALASLIKPSAPAGYSEEQVQEIVGKALTQQADSFKASQTQAIDAAVTAKVNQVLAGQQASGQQASGQQASGQQAAKAGDPAKA